MEKRIQKKDLQTKNKRGRVRVGELATRFSRMRKVFKICFCCRKKEKRFRFKFGIAKDKETDMIEVTITNEQKIPVSVSPVTASGKPAKIDGGLSWTVTSGDSTVVIADGGLNVELVSSDVPGDTVYLVEGDADLGSGVETISDTITLHVEGTRAANLGLKLGDAVAK